MGIETKSIEVLRQQVDEGRFVFKGTDFSNVRELARGEALRVLRFLLDSQWLCELDALLNVGDQLHDDIDEPSRYKLGSYYAVTERCPFAPQADGLQALVMLQAISPSLFHERRLCFGYGTALSYLGLADEIVGLERYAWKTDATVSPPDREGEDFERSNHVPRVALRFHGNQNLPMALHVSRRNPIDIDMYVEYVDVGGARVPCTNAVRTLVDCWLRPDLSFGIDRVIDAWKTYLTAADTSLEEVVGTLRYLFAHQQDQRSVMRSAFIDWLTRVHPEAGRMHSGWKGMW